MKTQSVEHWCLTNRTSHLSTDLVREASKARSCGPSAYDANASLSLVANHCFRTGNFHLGTNVKLPGKPGNTGGEGGRICSNWQPSFFVGWCCSRNQWDILPCSSWQKRGRFYLSEAGAGFQEVWKLHGHFCRTPQSPRRQVLPSGMLESPNFSQQKHNSRDHIAAVSQPLRDQNPVLPRLMGYNALLILYNTIIHFKHLLLVQLFCTFHTLISFLQVPYMSVLMCPSLGKKSPTDSCFLKCVLSCICGKEKP